MSIFQDERPTPFTLCMMGLFCSFIWVTIVYFFKDIVSLSIMWSLVCGYTLLSLFIWIIHSIFKCYYKKKDNIEINENIEINDSITLEPPKYVETIETIENIQPPDYNSLTE